MWWISMAAAMTHEVPSQHATLHDALLVADPGDVIEIDAGYDRFEEPPGPVLLDIDIELRGVSAQRPVLPSLEIAATVVIADVELGGQRFGVGGPFDIAVDVLEDAEVELLHVTLANPDGIGMRVQAEATASLEDVEASGFYAYSVVQADPESVLNVVDSTFETNGTYVLWIQDATVFVADSTFAENIAPYGGPAIHAFDGATVEIFDSVFEGNHAVWGTVPWQPFGPPRAQGGAILAVDTELELHGCTFAGNLSDEAGGAVTAEESTGLVLVPVTIVDTAFLLNLAVIAGGAVSFVGVEATLQGMEVYSNVAFGLGGGFSFVGVDSRIEDSFFLANTILDELPDDVLEGTAGGGIYAWQSIVELDGSIFLGRLDGGTQAQEGGHIGAVGSGLFVTDSFFRDGAAAFSGGAIATFESIVDLDRVDMLYNRAFAGAALEISDSSFSMRNSAVRRSLGAGVPANIVNSQLELFDNVFVNNRTTTLGALAVAEGVGGVMQRNWFCSNNDEGIGTVLYEGVTGALDMTNNHVVDNVSVNDGAAVVYTEPDVAFDGSAPDSVFRFVNNTVVGNSSIGLVGERGDIELVNNIIGRHQLGAWLPRSPRTLDQRHNLYWNNVINFESVDGDGSGESLEADPRFQGYEPGNCASNFWLALQSPARDIGDPAIIDVDGSQSDIGAFGGPEAALDNRDGDGNTHDIDCDDDDPARFPRAEEVPYDDVDQDCDGFDLCDVDADGFDADVCGGEDCDDDDPSMNPNARETLDVGVDSNCDGITARSWVLGGGGACQTAPGISGLLALLPAAALRRRRR